MNDRVKMCQNIGGYSAEESASMPVHIIEERNNMRVPVQLKKDVAVAVQLFRGVMDAVGDPEQAFNRLMVAEEASMNMLLHGNCGNPELSSMAKLVIERSRDGTRHRISYTLSLDDHAPIFDPSTVPDPTAEENLEKLTGRGLLTIKNIGHATLRQIPNPGGGKTVEYTWKEEFDTAPRPSGS